MLFLAIPECLAISGSESDLRAAVIVGILRFSSQPKHEAGPYRLCLTGEPPSSGKLQGSAGLGMGNNRSLLVDVLEKDRTPAGCAAIVLGPGLDKLRQRAIVKQAAAAGSIVLCDDCVDDSLAHASLQRKGDRILFSVDAALAREAQVSFSSQLLKLAVSVKQ